MYNDDFECAAGQPFRFRIKERAQMWTSSPLPLPVTLLYVYPFLIIRLARRPIALQGYNEVERRLYLITDIKIQLDTNTADVMSKSCFLHAQEWLTDDQIHSRIKCITMFSV